VPPDPPLSPAARDVRAEVAKLARDYRKDRGRDATGPELVLLLARRYISARLKRGQR
jgi:hypothetical protein